MGVIYSEIRQILRYIEIINKNDGLRPDFFDVVNRLRSEGLYYTEPTNPLILDEMSMMEDLEFIHATENLRLPLFFGSEDEKSQRSVPDYMPWDSEVVALFGFPGLNREFRKLEGFEVAYVLCGQCEIYLRTGKRVLKAGDLIIVPPNIECYITEADSDELTFIVPVLLHAKTFGSTFFSLMNGKDILSDFFTAVLTGHGKTNYLLFETGDNENIKHLARRIFLEQFYTDRHRESCSELLLKLLFSTTLRLTEMGNRVMSASENGNMTMMLSYIQANYRTLTLRGLAEKFHYSETYLSEVIKSTMGKNFIELVRNLKMREARELLEYSRLSVAQIAQKVGYHSTDHFTRVFKQVHGVTPRMYRER